jgi:PleD family two-component response regulator
MELNQDIVEREDGDYEYKYTAVISVEKIEQSISLLKQQLANTDYKVVKNMEYQMAMMSSVEPNTIILDLYDPQELHNERQALRDKINELEQLLKGE